MAQVSLHILVVSTESSPSVQRSELFMHKIVIMPLSNTFNIYLGAQKNSLIETVLLSVHNICFG